MNHDFSSLKRGATVAVRVEVSVGFNGYWYHAGKVQRKHKNGCLTVAYEDLARKQVSVKYNSEGYPVRPDGTVERRHYELFGGILVPTTDAMRRIFKHQQALSSIWRLTWPDLLLLQDYELDFINALLQEARLRGQAPRTDLDGA
jgi:hypothetical protein